MENIRKRINVKLINDQKEYLKYASQPILFHRKYLIRILLQLTV